MIFGTLEAKIAEKAEKRYNKLCADFNKEAARYQKKIKKLQTENKSLSAKGGYPIPTARPKRKKTLKQIIREMELLEQDVHTLWEAAEAGTHENEVLHAAMTAMNMALNRLRPMYSFAISEEQLAD
jgi:hypothetical protein